MPSLLLKNKIKFLNCCLHNRILKQTCQIKIQRLAMNLFFQGQSKTATRNKIISARLVIFIQYLLQKSRPLFFLKKSMATFIVMVQCVKVVESVQRDILLLSNTFHMPHEFFFFFFFFFSLFR